MTYPAVTRAEASILRRARLALTDIERRANDRAARTEGNFHADGRLAAKAGSAENALTDVLVGAAVWNESPQAKAVTR